MWYLFPSTWVSSFENQFGVFFCLQRQNTQRLWNTPSNDIDPKYHFSSGYGATSPSLIVCNFTLQNAWLIYDSIRFQNNKVTLQVVVCKKPLSMQVLMTRTKPHSTPEYGVGKNLIGFHIFAHSIAHYAKVIFETNSRFPHISNVCCIYGECVNHLAKRIIAN